MLFEWTTDTRKITQKNPHFSEVIGPKKKKIVQEKTFSSKALLALRWGHEIGLNFSVHCLICAYSSQVFQKCKI